MTDFLSSVTARSFGAETAIRPRVASLFEPVRNGEPALRDAPAEDPRDADVVKKVDAAPDDPRRAPNEDPVSVVVPQARADSRRHQTSVTDRETMSEESAVVPAKMRPPIALAPSQTESSNVFHASSPLRSNLKEPVPGGISILAAPSMEVETREKENPGRAANHHAQGPVLSQPVNSDLPRPASFLGSDLEDREPNRVPPAAPTTQPFHNRSFESGDRGLVLSPRIIRELTSQMQRAASAMNAGSGTPTIRRAGTASPAPDRESSVQVTIGRIEVRATSESKPVGRTRAASPVMSLEEYLHRRTQRGDR